MRLLREIDLIYLEHVWFGVPEKGDDVSELDQFELLQFLLHRHLDIGIDILFHQAQLNSLVANHWLVTILSFSR